MGEAEDRGLARRVAARANIQDVRLVASSIELEGVPNEGLLTYEVDISTSNIDWMPDQKLFSLSFAYDVKLTEQVVTEDDTEDAPAEQARPVASIAFTLAALFSFASREGEEPPSDEELAAYAATTGSFALHPFAREYVYDVTGRLRVPSLTLPVRLVAISEDEKIELT